MYIYICVFVQTKMDNTLFMHPVKCKRCYSVPDTTHTMIRMTIMMFQLFVL